MKGKRVAADIEPGPQAVQDELASVIGTEAARLLSDSKEEIVEIADRLNFQSLSAFYHLFKNNSYIGIRISFIREIFKFYVKIIVI